MVTDVFIICNKEQMKKVEDSVKESPTFHFIDPMTAKGRKESFKLRGHWGAKLDPFAIVKDGERPIKAFYSEAENVIDSLIMFLNNDVENL